MSNTVFNNPADRKAYIITGPTSGIGRCTALELARHGTVVLVGRDRAKLNDLQKTIEQRDRHAVSVVCDLSDLANVRRAAVEIVALNLPIAGLLNNAGMMQQRVTQNALGWDMTFATNHLGPFALTETLAPHLPDGTNVVFIASAVEDPERKPAVAAGFRGGRYISAEASARGEWKPGGSAKPGMDAYATSKQAILAATMVFARETPRLHFNAVEPGFTPATGLGRDAGAFVVFVSKYIVPLLVPLFMPFMNILSTPKRAARIITKILTDASGQTGVYYDEGGQPMQGSTLVRDPKFQDRVVAETHARWFRRSQHKGRSDLKIAHISRVCHEVTVVAHDEKLPRGLHREGWVVDRERFGHAPQHGAPEFLLFNKPILAGIEKFL